MADAVRPSDEHFSHLLQESLNTWTSYLGTENNGSVLPRHAVDLKPLASQTPAFLGDGVASADKKMAFSCEESTTTHLLVNGQSTWRTSQGACDLPPRIMSKQLILGVSGRLSVKLSEDSPLSDWPGVQGIPNYDKGNYLSVLYFAWAYILSARWVELLDRSVDHECQMTYTAHNPGASPPTNEQPMPQVYLGENISEEECIWWHVILRHGDKWDATTKYKVRIYFSPWSVRTEDAGFTVAPKLEGFPHDNSKPPSSGTAIEYLARFCLYHRIYAQCSTSLSGVLFIPFLNRKTISLPLPRQVPQLELKGSFDDDSISISALLNDHRALISKYMTLSLDIRGLRSLLYSTFFNPDIDCNLVSAWLNPAFAVINSISSEEASIATLLANRQPRFGILWLGAILTALAKNFLCDARVGMTTIDLPASAWSQTTHTFLTSNMGQIQSDLIRREDECRLLFITACYGHDRPPICSWKPFGSTQLCDTEIQVRQHVHCTGHCLQYESWEWLLTNDGSIRDYGKEHGQLLAAVSKTSVSRTTARVSEYTYDFSSQLLSEVQTRAIFDWLRSMGYPHNEKGIYQHSWFDLEGSDEDAEPDDAESDIEKRGQKKIQVERWLEGIE
ncbi:hypothetical protein N7456_011195 [Penicillium angulare]|uniref:Uncharacterized protein n=1 Tax=Penicillium angulare TaxID=116970 RepID=A0A9W9ETG0_9EURO|nr:hypothetical protein N7456_011195 [Penicillium angulare]